MFALHGRVCGKSEIAILYTPDLAVDNTQFVVLE